MLCTKCEKDKEEKCFEFRKDRGSYRTVCKECRNERNRSNYPKIATSLSEKRKIKYARDKDSKKEKARERYWKNRDSLLEKARERSSYGKSKYNQEYRIRNKDKFAVRQAVSRALKNGKLTKADSCQICGFQESLQAHHQDYSQPLMVIWLCIPCHKKVHSKYFNKGDNAL